MNRVLSTLCKFFIVDFTPLSIFSVKINPGVLLSKSTKNMDSNMEELKVLNKRLNTVETEVKRLMKEIVSIRGSMHKLLKEKTTIVSTSTKREYSIDVTDAELNDICDKLEDHPSKRFKADDFTCDSDHVVVYTDGACENNGKFGAKAGIGVWFGHDHPLNVAAPVIGKATNNNAEIQACVKAIDIVYEKGIRKLCIKTDSQFVINAMTSWITKWKKNNWTLSTGGPVKNKEEFMKLDQYCNKMDSIKWEHVRGHKGIVGNEKADELARQGALAYKFNK